ncbi:MAG: HupE/UreJ family protein [Rhodocyclaceae bacterium]|nr:HupE/UreJ family protein [Rhodocyclaceae bacterium]MCA3056641.1 HupE/UreJ family protein [Rhodocyclaceae bacterium]MCA3065110.1 HupE/UreJ family protein [Rhodocyclaceae bacterium]MCA3080582.1 HupE/UreJ family protein [Rhodocyclaceae bacterium]
MVDYVRMGAEHVLQGLDHLLFLLFVLAAGWHWRTLFAVLTCFACWACANSRVECMGRMVCAIFNRRASEGVRNFV